MMIYCTRHAQAAFQQPNASRWDPPLTDLGCRQATWLGGRLKSSRFTGPIFCSPFHRALQTAQCVADVTGSTIYLAWRIREIAMTDESFSGFAGMTTKRCIALYSRLAKHQEMPDRWWTEKAETQEQVEARCRPLVDEILVKGEDCLVVGHGASITAFVSILLQKSGYQLSESIPCLNTSLSAFYSDGQRIEPQLIHDDTHVPLLERTSNSRYLLTPVRANS